MGEESPTNQIISASIEIITTQSEGYGVVMPLTIDSQRFGIMIEKAQTIGPVFNIGLVWLDTKSELPDTSMAPTYGFSNTTKLVLEPFRKDQDLDLDPSIDGYRSILVVLCLNRLVITPENLKILCEDLHKLLIDRDIPIDRIHKIANQFYQKIQNGARLVDLLK